MIIGFFKDRSLGTVRYPPKHTDIVKGIGEVVKKCKLTIKMMNILRTIILLAFCSNLLIVQLFIVVKIGFHLSIVFWQLPVSAQCVSSNKDPFCYAEKKVDRSFTE